MEFITTYAVELGAIAALIAIVEFTLKPLRKLFGRKSESTPKIKATKGGVVNMGTVKGDIKTSKTK
jgi:hypothetical protein